MWTAPVGQRGLEMHTKPRSSAFKTLITATLSVSVLVNSLATFWEPASRVAFLSFVYYYQPAQVMRSGAPPLGDMAVLTLAGASLWVIGGVIWNRRSVLTV